MILKENYNTAKQKYGNLADEMKQYGIKDEFLLSACRFYKENHFSKQTLKTFFQKWNDYIFTEKNNKIDINILSFNNADTLLNQKIQYYKCPNKIYDKNGIKIGEFKSKRDALLFSFSTRWCINDKTNNYFNRYTRNGDRLFILDSGIGSCGLVVIQVSMNGDMTFWDFDNERLNKRGLMELFNLLPNNAVDFIKNLPKFTNKQRYNSISNIITSLKNRFTENVHRQYKRKLKSISILQIVQEEINAMLYNEKSLLN